MVSLTGKFGIRSKRASRKQLLEIIQLLADLLANGFTLRESLHFILKIPSFSPKYLQQLLADLEKGETLADGLSGLGLAPVLVTQIRLSEFRGDLPRTLTQIGRQATRMDQYRQNFFKVLSYPALLLLFLVGMLIGLRLFLLPQLEVLSANKANLSFWFIRNGPLLLLGFGVLLFVMILASKRWLKRHPPIAQAHLLARLPIFRRYYRDYLTAYISMEWGRLFIQGIEMKQILSLMQTPGHFPLLQALGMELERGLQNGLPVYQQLRQWSFFSEELSTIVQQGEASGKLGDELMLYSEFCWNRLFRKIERGTQWLQPLIFLFVALVIVAVYAAMLLPIYQNMEGFL